MMSSKLEELAMDEATRQVAALWTAVYGEPPVVTSDPATMLAILVDTLPEPLTVLPALPGDAGREAIFPAAGDERAQPSAEAA